MHAKNRDRQRVGPPPADRSARLPGARDQRRRRVGRVLAAAVVAALAASACAAEPTVSTDETRPTFTRATSPSFVFESPVATVGGMIAPADEGEPWVTVGSVLDPGKGSSTAAVWSSDDGSRWSRHDVPPADSSVSEAMSGIASTSAGLVAVGSVGTGDAGDAAIWRWVDGKWTRVSAPALGGDHEQWAFAVASGESGILVAGGESAWGHVRPRLWFSPDGEQWEAVDGGADGPFNEMGTETLRAITAYGDGFVAVGSRKQGSDQDGVAWFSPDGRTWEIVAAEQFGGPGRQALLSVAATGGELVAGGYRVDGGDRGKPVVWRSTDGRTWSEPSKPLSVHDDSRTHAGDMSVRVLRVVGEKLYAAGGSDWRPHMWHSDDQGRTWKRLPNPVHGDLFKDGVDLVDIASDGSSTMALGLEPTVLQLRNDRWQDVTSDEFPNGGVQPFATSVARKGDITIVAGGRYTAARGDTRERYVGQVWRKTGSTWEPVESEAFEHGHILDVAAYDGGFVAVGFEDFGVASERLIGADASPDAIIWTSEDGVEWTRVGASQPRIDTDDLTLLPEATEEMAAVIAQMEAEAPPVTDAPAGGDGTHSLSGVAPLAQGFAAAGVRFDGRDVDPVMLTSGDAEQLNGQDTGLGGPGTQQFRDVCVGPDDVIVAVGESGKDGDYDVAVRRRDQDRKWSAATAEDGSFEGPGRQQAFGCAAGEDGFIVVGSDDRGGDSDARIWVSRDGATWTRIVDARLGGAGEQWAAAAAPVPGGGWLVGGADTASGTSDAALWRISVDGEVSRRDVGEPALGSQGEQAVKDLLVTDDLVIVVGEDHGRVGIWESTILDR